MKKNCASNSLFTKIRTAESMKSTVKWRHKLYRKLR